MSSLFPFALLIHACLFGDFFLYWPDNACPRIKGRPHLKKVIFEEDLKRFLMPNFELPFLFQFWFATIKYNKALQMANWGQDSHKFVTEVDFPLTFIIDLHLN